MAKFSYADQDWNEGTTTYWFETEDESYGVVEGERGYSYMIRSDGSLVDEKSLDKDMLREIKITDEIRKEASGL